ncbi:MAG: hypothetical protein JSR24_11080 [Proteobacteria bacterium]|nr:hypothetical protein [Pseudomonadota bacterium]
MALRHAALDRRLGRLGKVTRRGPTFSEVVAEADRPYRAAHIFGLFARALAGTDMPPAPAAPAAPAIAARPSTPAVVAPPREPVRPDQHTLVSWEEVRRIPWIEPGRIEPYVRPLSSEEGSPEDEPKD